MTAPAPAVEAHRQQIRDSYAKSIAQASDDDADAFRRQLQTREQQWQTEDDEEGAS